MRSGALAGFSAAAVGLVIFAVHTLGFALTEHIWSLTGQVLFIGGGLLGLSQSFGRSRRKRR